VQSSIFWAAVTHPTLVFMVVRQCAVSRARIDAPIVIVWRQPDEETTAVVANVEAAARFLSFGHPVGVPAGTNRRVAEHKFLSCVWSDVNVLSK
jgi:hypothetical protein